VSKIPISKIQGRLVSIKDGRSVEFFGGNFSFNVPGGIEPNETISVSEIAFLDDHISNDLIEGRSKENWQLVITKINGTLDCDCRIRLKEIEKLKEVVKK